MTVNMPILAYSSNEDKQEMVDMDRMGSADQQVIGAYNIQVQDNPPSKLTSHGNVTDFIRMQEQSINTQQTTTHNGNVAGQISTPKVHRNNSPDKIFDPKPPNFTGPNSSKQNHENGNEIHQNNSGQPQPVQNVFQFNLRVNNNNMQPGILVASDGSNRNKPQQQNNNPSHSYSGTAGKSKNKERRPTSSKQGNGGGPIGGKNQWQNQSHGHQVVQAPYFGQNTRKLVKKRPQSATRKTLMQGTLVTRHQQQQNQQSFKSPQTNFTGKKQSLTRGGYDHPSSLPSQKQQRLAQYNMQQMNHTGAPLAQSELVASAEMSNGLAHVNSTAGSANATTPLITAGNFHPYNRTMKMPNQNAMTANTKTFSAGKVVKQLHPTSIFGSPDKGGRQLKSKIPTMTLQSREDLYEQNMHTKMQINNLRNENRKINTKLVVLENQLSQKDKLFEDMYKAAFQQVRFPATANNQTAPTPSSNSAGSMFYPAGQTMNSQNNATMGSSFGAIGVAQKSIYGANAPLSNNQQQHAQAQQLINNYKRTIREQSRELDKRDLEIEQIKRSVKMTQINQVLVENETYRKECIRLRENLENTIWQNSQLNKVQQHQTTNTQQTLELAQQARNSESPSGTFQRDHTSPLTETHNLTAKNIEIQQKYDLLYNENRNLSTQNGSFKLELENQGAEIKSLQSQLLDTKQISDKTDANKAYEKQFKDQERKKIFEIQTEHQKEVDKLTAQLQTQVLAINELKTKNMAVPESDATIEENEELNTVEEQLEVSKQKYKELERDIDGLVINNQKAVQDLRKVETQNETLLEKLRTNAGEIAQKDESIRQNEEVMAKQEASLKKNEEIIVKKDLNIKRTGSVAEQRMSMYNELMEEKEKLEAKIEEMEKKSLTMTSKASKLGAIANVEKKLEFKQNEMEAQKYELEKKLAEQEKLIGMLRQGGINNYQSPPVAPQDANRRRSTKTKSQKLNSAKSDSQFGDGDSSFQRADESEAPGRNNNHKDQSADERSDLGFTSNDDSEPLMNENSKENQNKSKDKPQWKIQVNDKTFFGPDGLPLSPKEINLDSPNVQEGLTRLRHACQVHFIKHDSIENFLYGKDYKPEAKISIRQTKEAGMEKLGMVEEAALDFARYLHELNGQSISYNEVDAANQTGGVFVDQQKTTLAMKIMIFVVQQVQREIVYFRQEKEEKMKLIIGEKLQEASNKVKLLNVIQRHSKKNDQLKYEDLKKIFEQAQFNYNKETMQCCFIFLLKKRQDGELLRIRKSDLINFIKESVGKAADFTMTGSKFPLETELVYSSDSDDEQVPTDKDFKEQEGQQTLKSADAVQKVGASLANQVRQRLSDPNEYKSAAQPKHAAQEDDNYSSDDDDEFGANESRSEYSGVAKRETLVAKKQEAKPEQQQLEDEDEESDDEFGANESRSEYSRPAVSQHNSSNMNVRNSMPNLKPESTKVKSQDKLIASEYSDGEFGANESRSEYSNIPEEIANSADDQKKTDSNYLSIQQQTAIIEDSINDRDLESSVARTAVIAPLPKVPEAEEQNEVTIEPKEPVNVNQQLNTTTGASISSLHVQIQKSKSFPPTRLVDDDNMIVDDQPKKEGDQKRGSLVHQKTDLNANYKTTVPKTKARKRPMVHIDMSTIKGQIGKPSPINSVKNSIIKIMPTVQIGTVEQNSDFSGATPQGGQLLPEIAPVELRPLKEDVPVPFGITVQHEDESECSPEVTPLLGSNNDYNDDSDGPLAPLKPDVPTPFGINIAHVQHSEYGGNDSDQSDSQQKENDLLEDSVISGMDLEPLKAEVPTIFGIKVAHVQHSEYGGNDSDPEQKEKDFKPIKIEKQVSSEDYSEDEQADKVVAEDPKAEAVAVQFVPVVNQEVLKPYLEQPKTTETNTVKVENLQTDSSEEGFELPSVKDITGNNPPSPYQKEPPASAANIGRMNGSSMEINSLIQPPQSPSKFTDSFGQGSMGMLSAGKRKNHCLPPLELLSLKEVKATPGGIQLGALLTDASHRPDESSVIYTDSIQKSAHVRDFKAGADSEDEDDYSDDGDQEERKTSNNILLDDIESPLRLKQGEVVDQQQLPAIIQKEPPQIIVDSNRQDNIQSEIEEDYEF